MSNSVGVVAKAIGRNKYQMMGGSSRLKAMSSRRLKRASSHLAFVLAVSRWINGMSSRRNKRVKSNVNTKMSSSRLRRIIQL